MGQPGASRHCQRFSRSPALCRCASVGLAGPICAHVLGPKPNLPIVMAIERFCQAEHDGPPNHSRNGITSKMPIAAIGMAPACRTENARPGTGRDRSVMNDIDDDRDGLAFAQLDLARYHTMPCSSRRPCVEAVRDGPTRSTPASTRWCTVRSASHRARWRSKRSNRECLAAGTR
jgi:hypothetical protein